MGIRLQRHLAAPRSMESGQWTDVTPTRRVVVACPGCGGQSELPETHTVRGGGIVTPIWSCPHVCPLIEFITLGAWHP